ncbi:MAG TPA: hypothetical protein VFQ53_39480 [Kofleriaceae bacterium]|nr:hypothetical protein [Kofleriaceae bacterium]
MTLRPTEGARFLLERSAESEDRATYRATIFTPDAEFHATLAMASDGSATLDAPTGAPAELEHMLVTLAKLTARGADKRREDGLVVWPPRILRWRGPKG